MRSSEPRIIAVSIALLLTAVSCGKKDPAPDQEIAQNVGDQMSAVDEGGGSTGAYSENEVFGARRTFARLLPSEVQGPWYERLLLPRAEATSCLLAGTFGSCSSNVVTRTFNSCTVGLAVFSGTVTFTWSNGGLNNCTMPAANDSVSRKPNFTITGLRGGTFTASATGTIGQTITRGSAAGSFTFSNDGIRRVLKDGGGTTLLDFTTTTTTSLAITGAARSGRVLNGGTLHVVNNVSGTTCDFSPSNVTWTSTCNCATSGSWTGSCSDGKTATVTLTGCGTATLEVGSGSTDVTFDRCYGS